MRQGGQRYTDTNQDGRSDIIPKMLFNTNTKEMRKYIKYGIWTESCQERQLAVFNDVGQTKGMFLAVVKVADCGNIDRVRDCYRSGKHLRLRSVGALLKLVAYIYISYSSFTMQGRVYQPQGKRSRLTNIKFQPQEDFHEGATRNTDNVNGMRTIGLYDRFDGHALTTRPIKRFQFRVGSIRKT